MKYSNELHKMHKIMGLDAQSVIFLAALYGFTMFTTIWTLLLSIPLFFYFLSAQKKANRGFIRHFLYSIGLDKVSGYPSLEKQHFNE